MGLERVHRTDYKEHFGPVRLGPQDLRDVAAVFKDLDSQVQLTLPQFRTKFYVLQHQTEDIEDVLKFADADVLPQIIVFSAELRLSFQATEGTTTIDQPNAASDAADRQAVEEAAQRLRQIVRARQVGRFESLRQRGPGKWLMIALLALPAILFGVTQGLLRSKHTTGATAAAALEVLSLVPLLLLNRRPRKLIRLRGQEEPWWEQHQGLIALVSAIVAVVAVVVPLVT